jgi:hypothetical protein
VNNVLEELKILFDNNMTGDFQTKRNYIGYYSDTFNISKYGDLPFVLLEPGEENMRMSDWGGHLIKFYSVRVYIIMFLRNPRQVQTQFNRINQGKTLNEFSNEIVRLLGTNKTLSGKVRLQNDRFQIEQFTDKEGRQAKVIKLQYIDDLIPYASQTLNQTDMIKQI